MEPPLASPYPTTVEVLVPTSTDKTRTHRAGLTFGPRRSGGASHASKCGFRNRVKINHAKMRAWRPRPEVASLKDKGDVCAYTRLDPFGLQRCRGDTLDQLRGDLGCCFCRDRARELQQVTAGYD